VRPHLLVGVENVGNQGGFVGIILNPGSRVPHVSRNKYKIHAFHGKFSLMEAS